MADLWRRLLCRLRGHPFARTGLHGLGCYQAVCRRCGVLVVGRVDMPGFLPWDTQWEQMAVNMGWKKCWTYPCKHVVKESRDG